MLGKERAAELMTNIRTHALGIESALAEFIGGRGWVALGYQDVRACWQDWLGEVRLVRAALRLDDVLALFVYAFDDDQVPAPQIGEALNVEDEVVEHLLKQKRLDVAPEDAETTHVRSHQRGRPGRATSFALRFDPDEREWVKATIEAHGHDVDAFIKMAVILAVRRLEEGGVGK